MVYTIAEMAEKLKVSTTTLYRLVSKKAVPHFRVGSEIRFTDDEVAEWIEGKTKKDSK